MTVEAEWYWDEKSVPLKQEFPGDQAYKCFATLCPEKGDHNLSPHHHRRKLCLPQKRPPDSPRTAVITSEIPAWV